MDLKSEAIPHFEILRFDIRYSAVRCSNYVKFHTRFQVSGKIDTTAYPEHSYETSF